MPKKSGSRIVLVCRNCGTKKNAAQKKDFKVSTTPGKKDKIIVVEKKKALEVLPKTNIDCPKCENKEAFWWMLQTRSGDEPPTRFYRCIKCNHTWREYE